MITRTTLGLIPSLLVFAACASARAEVASSYERVRVESVAPPVVIDSRHGDVNVSGNTDLPGQITGPLLRDDGISANQGVSST